MEKTVMLYIVYIHVCTYITWCSIDHFTHNVLLFCRLQKPNLILNVDGVIAVSFVDLLRHSGAFSA